jgi:hypothetical protein
MLNKNAKKWVAALRSGNYQQGIYKLHRGNKFCCLGVACDLYSKENYLEIRDDIANNAVAYDNETQYLPRVVGVWLGLRTRDGHYGKGSRTLTKLNDSKKLSFSQIARHIVQNQHRLFSREI